MRKLLRPEHDHLKRRKTPEKFKQVTSVSELCHARFSDVIKALKGNLLKGVEYTEDKWTKEELLKARVLVKKYRSKEWVYQL